MSGIKLTIFRKSTIDYRLFDDYSAAIVADPGNGPKMVKKTAKNWVKMEEITKKYPKYGNYVGIPWALRIDFKGPFSALVVVYHAAVKSLRMEAERFT